MKNGRVRNALLSAILNSFVVGMVTLPVACQDNQSVRVEGRLPSYIDAAIFPVTIRFWLLQPPATGASTEQELKLVHVVKVNQSNHYSAEGLPPGQYRIECFTTYMGSDWTWRELVSPGDDPVVVDFLNLRGLLSQEGPPWTLGGKVLLPDGSPATRATVTLTDPYNPSEASQVHTDEGGRFTMRIGRSELTFYSIVHAFDDTHKPAVVVASRDALTERSVVLKLGEY